MPSAVENLWASGRELLSVCRSANGSRELPGGRALWHSLGGHCSSRSGQSAAWAPPIWRWKRSGLAIPTPAGAENFALPRRERQRPLGRDPRRRDRRARLGLRASPRRLQGDRARSARPDRRARRGPSAAATASSRPAGPTSARPSIPASISTPAPARIPSTHRAILGYARRFGVQLEPFVNVNRNAGWDFGGKVQPERRMVNDMRGHLAELLAKAIDQHALDQARAQGRARADSANSSAFYGQLDDKGRYTPGGSSGYSVEGGGYNQAPVPLPPLGFKELRAVASGRPALCVRAYLGHAGDHAPAGRRHGSHRPCHLRAGQARRCGCDHRSPPSAGSATASGSSTAAAGDRGGLLRLHAARCRCSRESPATSRPPRRRRSPGPRLICTASSWRSRRRVSGRRDDFIYGGLAWTDRLNENVIYPSDRYRRRQGRAGRRLCRGLDQPGQSRRFANLSHEERFRICREFDRGAASGPVAAAEQGRDRRLGGSPLIRRASARCGPTSTRVPAAAGQAAARSMPSC